MILAWEEQSDGQVVSKAALPRGGVGDGPQSLMAGSLRCVAATEIDSVFFLPSCFTPDFGRESTERLSMDLKGSMRASTELW
jgi:hypothetical protein